MYTKGTQYAIPQDKLALLSKFMRETYYATIRGQYMLFDVLGRGVSRPGVTKKIHTALFAKRMIELDPDHANEFKDIIARLDGKQPRPSRTARSWRSRRSSRARTALFSFDLSPDKQ